MEPRMDSAAEELRVKLLDWITAQKGVEWSLNGKGICVSSGCYAASWS